MDQLIMRQGETREIALPGHGGAGYQWLAVAEITGVVSISRLGVRPGLGGDERFVIAALTPGEVVLHFSQRRAFGPERPPRDSRDIRVRVQ